MDQVICKDNNTNSENSDLKSALKSARKEIRLLKQENGLRHQRIMELQDKLSNYVCYQCEEDYDKSKSVGECGSCEHSICDDCYDDIHSCHECNQDTCERCISKYCDTCSNVFCISCPEHDCVEN